MRNEGPRDTKDAGVALQRSVQQFRQQAIEARRQIILDLANLLIHNMKIIEQPLRRRGDRLLRGGGPHDCAMRFGEDVRVVVKAWGEGTAPS